VVDPRARARAAIDSYPLFVLNNSTKTAAAKGISSIIAIFKAVDNDKIVESC